MTSNSWKITLAPIIVALAFLIIDFTTDFQITNEQVQLLEFMIGSTIFGGVANKGYQRYIAYKEKIKNG